MDLSQTGVTCAVITAAGLSSRMGAFKPLLPFAGTTIAARCVENFRRAGVENIIMLPGHRGDELRAALAGTGVRFLENPDYRTTQSLTRSASASRRCRKGAPRIPDAG
jgi:CTP:molybdopterin cytidylyltransferase MocA